MSGFIICAVYVIVIGVAGFLLGRLIPGHWFHYDSPPYREWRFENHGHFYRKIGIHRWHKLLPDMSRILPGTMPEKRLTAHISADQAEVMVRETCVAEFIHVFLSLVGVYLIFLWPGIGGWLFFAAYFLLGNFPFILIQRFNRPKLRMLLDKCRAAEARQQKQTEV